MSMYSHDIDKANRYHQTKRGESRNLRRGLRSNDNFSQTDKTERNSSDCLCLEGAAFYDVHPSSHDLGLPHKLHIAHLDAPKPSLQCLREIWCPHALDSFYWEPAFGCVPYIIRHVDDKDTGIYVYQNLYERQHKPTFSLFLGGESKGDYENLWEAIGEGERLLQAVY